MPTLPDGDNGRLYMANNPNHLNPVNLPDSQQITADSLTSCLPHVIDLLSSVGRHQG